MRKDKREPSQSRAQPWSSQAKRAKQQQEAIELNDDDDEVPIDETLAAVENVPPHASAAGTSGSAVKTESRA